MSGDVFSVPASAVNSRVASGPCLSLSKPRLLIFVHKGTAFMSPDELVDQDPTWRGAAHSPPGPEDDFLML